jgi:AcrR family transcriptional regulator
MAKPTFLNLPEEKRTQIEDVATDEFARFSFGKASLSRIVSRLGIAKGSIYQYFDNKLDLYTWLLERAARKKIEYFGGASTPEPGKFFEWYEHALFGGLKFGMENPRLVHLWLGWFHSDEPQLKPVVRRVRRERLDCAESIFKDAQVHGEVRADLDPKTLAILLTATQNSMLEVLQVMAGVDSPEELFEHHTLEQFSDDQLKKVVHELVEIFKHGTANPDGPEVKEGAVPHVNIDETMSRIFDAEGDADE